MRVVGAIISDVEAPPMETERRREHLDAMLDLAGRDFLGRPGASVSIELVSGHTLELRRRASDWALSVVRSGSSEGTLTFANVEGAINAWLTHLPASD